MAAINALEAMVHSRQPVYFILSYIYTTFVLRDDSSNQNTDTDAKAINKIKKK